MTDPVNHPEAGPSRVAYIEGAEPFVYVEPED